MTIIDSHIHYGDDAPELLSLLDDLDIKLLNITFVDGPDADWMAQAQRYQSLSRHLADRYAWCTTFDLPDFQDSGYVERVLAGLERDFATGAVACKVWKNVGMEVKRPDGAYLMIDDPIFSPIFDYIARADRTLLLHIGEPLACWQPLAEQNPHANYYRSHPEWHMYGRTDVPSHADLIAARDNVVARHSDLRIVGAHLGSLEYDVDEVAKRLALYPNFAVDMSARVADMASQDSEKVRRFMTDHADRVLFGTDVVMRHAPSEMPAAEREQALASLRETYEMHFRYFGTSGRVNVRGIETDGLNLGSDILEKFYFKNATNWYPGI